MQREGADPESMDMNDFLCDFCAQAWSMDRPMVEGHRGACVCGNCLTIAWTEIVEGDVSDQPEPDEPCTLCKETGRSEAHWRSPMTGALACKRCIKQSAGVLHKDRDIDWTKPTPG